MSHTKYKLDLHRLSQRPARALLAQKNGTIYLGSHMGVYRSQDGGESWSHVSSLPRPFHRRLVERSRLATRLLRHEVKALAVLDCGAHVAANRSWVFHAKAGETMMRPCRVETRGQVLSPPMTISIGPDDRVLFGEYNSKTAHNLPVRLFVSEDGGSSFDVARVFEPGSILHIHNLVYDARLKHYWVLAGDHGQEPGIGALSCDLKDFDWVAKGMQQFRAVEVFDFGDHLIFGMDSEKEANAVIRFEKSSGRTERLRELDGSCIYACRFGRQYLLSTTVEPSAVNRSTQASLWMSHDGDHWEKVFSARKDRLHPVYFQYGSIVLPRGESDRETILFSGQALRGLDGRAYVAQCREAPEDSA